MIDGGWLDFECIHRGVLFGFLKGKYFPVFKLKPLTTFDFMIESRVFVMQHILIKDNSQGT